MNMSKGLNYCINMTIVAQLSNSLYCMKMDNFTLLVFIVQIKYNVFFKCKIKHLNLDFSKFLTLWSHSNKVKYITSYKIKTFSIFYKNNS